MSSLARTLARPLDPAHAAAKGADVLVVLGAKLTADGRLGPALAERVAAAVDAFAAGVAPRILMTGAHEARAMRREAIRLGVPASAIFVEEQSLTTRENATKSARLIADRGWHRAILVTQPFHRRRSRGAFRRAGVECTLLPFSGAQQTLRAVMREYFALGYYVLRRWI